MWIARNKDGDIRIFSHKPKRNNTNISWTIKNADCGYVVDDVTKESLKDLTWEDEPIEVKVAIPMEYYVNKHLI